MIRIAALLLGSLALTGCGLRPLYAGGEGGAVVSAMQSIAVDPIEGRTGWLVRNALAEHFRGSAGGPTHRLEVELDDDITSFGIRGDRSATRERRSLRARYRLVEVATGTVVLDATAGSDAGIDVVSSEYATVAAEETAAERLSKVVAEQIVARVGLYLSRSAANR